MLIKQHKSGQATIVLIVVTMMTVLGVAVASSSQSRINLRDTVYSTQSVQAISCAEAGADRALVDSHMSSDASLGSTVTLSSTGNYAVEGCDNYSAKIDNYPPASPGKVTVLSIPEGSTQEFNAQGFTSNKTVLFKSNDTANDAAVAIYVYSGSVTAPVVSRYMVYCNGAGAGSAPGDFSSVNPSTNMTQDDGTPVQGEQACSYTLTIPASPIAVRVRPLFADVIFQFPSFQGSTGYKIVSTGTAGQVQRDITVTRFYGQLSGAFDEAIVSGGTIEDD